MSIPCLDVAFCARLRKTRHSAPVVCHSAPFCMHVSFFLLLPPRTIAHCLCISHEFAEFACRGLHKVMRSMWASQSQAFLILPFRIVRISHSPTSICLSMAWLTCIACLHVLVSTQYGGAFRDNSQGNVTFIGCSFRVSAQAMNTHAAPHDASRDFKVPQSTLQRHS